MTRPDRALLLNAGLAASILVFIWPQLSASVRGASPWYPLVTVIFTLLIVSVVVSWPGDARPPALFGLSLSPVAVVVAVAAAGAVSLAIYRWTQILAWRAYEADMLIVVREATRRVLGGRTPYATYRAYDAPWDMAMPYGPGLWGPFVAAQVLRLDFRFVTIAGELFVPLWCGAAAVVESARGHAAAAVSWLAVLAALLIAFDVQAFTLIGHTPVYWPLLPLLAVAVGGRRWLQAACLLGVLVAARTTMVAIVPVFLMAVWRADRERFPAALVALTITVIVAFAPFAIWDVRALWDNMVLSYPRVMKAAVWPVLAHSGIETIGLTEWLLERQLASLVIPAQLLAMAGAYVAAWSALRRGAAPLPWMALALFVFSMTTLYPVHYLYYDVLLLLVSAAIADTLAAGAATAAAAWLASATILAVAMFVAARMTMSPFPHAVAGEAASDRAWRGGFAAAERDGERRFSWIVGHQATIVLPRSAAGAADIVLSAQSPFDGDRPAQSVTAMLNGQLLGHETVAAGWQDLRFTAPRSAWWVGFNQLQLAFSSTISPRDAGSGDDTRPLALALSRVDVVPARK